ncbi:DUF3558 domain-containing protein [Streptomyces sp. NPDC057499]|uniref:DUF3558 domain-containing protein n=1 Tax=Streptomyces sp. NPDC057499 TaxID=3346150 RepID=UPI0036BE8EDA
MAYATGTALLAALVVGCSADTGADGSAADGKSGETTVAAAAPGKYRTLPEACGAVTASTLKDLLPGTGELPEEQQRKVYEGSATVTYNTERRVGCNWKSDTSASSHTLSVDFERVVSYDPTVSDDDRALEVYTTKVTAAGLSSPSGSPGSTGSTGSTKPSSPDASADRPGTGHSSHALATSATATASADENGGKSEDKGNGDDATGGSDGSDEDLQPRLLDGLGDDAFLNDLLTRSGSTAQHRTVSVVFRTSNVIVTVEYTEQPGVSTVVPESKDLQEKAQALARNLVEKFSE